MSIRNLDDKTVFFKKKLETTWPVPRPRSPREQDMLRATIRVDWVHSTRAAFMGGEQDIEWEKSLGPGHRVWSL